MWPAAQLPSRCLTFRDVTPHCMLWECSLGAQLPAAAPTEPKQQNWHQPGISSRFPASATCQRSRQACSSACHAPGFARLTSSVFQRASQPAGASSSCSRVWRARSAMAVFIEESGLTEAQERSHEHYGKAGVRRVPPRSLVVHAVAFSWFAFVWAWHLTPAAAGLPGNHGFGWFFRFLTFYSFSLQTLQLGMATADDWQRFWHGSSRWTRPTDDLACAIFAFTHVVSIMFYTIQGTTKMAVEGGSAVRPPWLDVSVHAFNTLVAWADLLSSDKRSFSRASERLSSVLVLAYLCYLMLCRHMNGRFPYPILNALPYPWGFAALVGCGLALFVAAFRAGKLMNRRLRHVSLSIKITDELLEEEEEEAADAAGPMASSAERASAAAPKRRSYLQLGLIRSRRGHARRAC